MEKNQTETEPKATISKPRMAILVSFAMVMLFIFTFGCYGCSYQPVFEEPTVEVAIDVVSRLAGNRWVIDDTEGIPVLPELFGLGLKELAFGNAQEQDSKLEMTLTATNKAVLHAMLVFDEQGGFALYYEGAALPISINYSQSRDNLTEMLTLSGQSSNIRCYYLKQ